MKFFVQNTNRGLVPMSDEDFDAKQKLKIGEIYSVEVKKARNYEFHKKYFALILCAWEYQSEKRQEFFNNNIDVFRKSVQVSAGYCDRIYNATLRKWVDVPKSISFEKMDELEFNDLYKSVRNVLFMVFLTHISEEEFELNLINF
jgi:hypothetical protein